MENFLCEVQEDVCLKNIIIIGDEWIYSECLKKIFDSLHTYQYYSITGFLNSEPHLLSDVDVILLDIKVGNENGLDLLPFIKSHNPFVPVIVITSLSDHASIKNAFENGVSGYLLKGESMTDIYEQVLNCIQKKRLVISHEIIGSLVKYNTQKSSGSKFENVFTDRERNVISYLKKGHTQKEIASSLSIAAATVNQHLKHIYQKMNVRSKTELLYKMLN